MYGFDECAGVSAATIYHVIKKSRYVSPELEAHFQDAIEVLAYSSNRPARVPSRKNIRFLPDRLKHYSKSMHDGLRGSLVIHASTALALLP
jgi:DNA-binding LacI/PurR family transcriptional regulator